MFYSVNIGLYRYELHSDLFSLLYITLIEAHQKQLVESDGVPLLISIMADSQVRLLIMSCEIFPPGFC